jgi:hypothetical protein
LELQPPDRIAYLASTKRGTSEDEVFDMKIALVAAVSALVLTSSLALAQNTSGGSTTTSGDSAVSPAKGNDAASNGGSHPSLGAGINSGAVDNGTTGDTIGTGTLSKPSTGQGTMSPRAAGIHKE